MSDSATRLTFQFSGVAKLTGEELAQQFSETEILQDRRHEPPSDAAFSELARRIRTVHSNVRLQRGPRKLTVANIKQASVALQSLVEVLPKISTVRLT
jgi:hypothetical protein